MILYLVLLLVSAGCYLNAPKTMDPSFMALCVIQAITQIVLFFLYNKKHDKYHLNKIHLRHSVAFVFFFFVVFYQSDIDYILGFIDITESYTWYDTSVVCRCLALSNIALSCLMIGYRLHQSRETKKYRNTFVSEYTINNKFLLSIIIAVALIIYIIYVPKEYLAGGYSKVEQGSIGLIIHILTAAYIATFAAYSYDSRNTIKFRDFLIPLILVGIYIFIILISGRRTEAIMVASLLLISYCYLLREKANNKLLLILGVFGVLVFSGVALIRSGEATSLADSTSSLSKSSSIMPFTKELANSVNTLHLAASHFPNQYDYTMGTSFVLRFLYLIPGSNTILGNLLADVPQSETLITQIADTSWGMGTSIIADLYIAFGPVGVALFFVLFGAFLRYLEIGTFVKNSSPWFLALSFTCFAQFAFTCRGAVANLFNGFPYALIFLLIVCRPQKHY